MDLVDYIIYGIQSILHTYLFYKLILILIKNLVCILILMLYRSTYSTHTYAESCCTQIIWYIFIGLRMVVGSANSNTWLFRFILVCATLLRMYIWYDDKINFIRTDTCFRSTYLLITNIVCIIIIC